MSITRKGLLGLASGGLLAAAVGTTARPAVAATARAPERIGPARRTLIRNADVITLDAQLGELHGTDVLMEGGKIVAIGKALAVDGAEVVDATGMILMPGMVDGHRHIWQSVHSGAIPKISPVINAYINWKMRVDVCYTPEDAYLAQYAGGLLSIDSGVTSVLDFCHTFHSAEAVEQAVRGLRDSGLPGTFAWQLSRHPVFGPGGSATMAQVTANSAQAPDDDHWRIAEHVRSLFSGDDDLLRFGLASPIYQDAPISRTAETFARIRRLQPHVLAVHYHRSDKPFSDQSLQNVRQMGEAGLLGPDFHIAHGHGMHDVELQMMRDNDSMICATTMGEHSYPFPSVHGRAARAGVKVGIGIDTGVAFTHDYFQHVRGSYYNLFRTDEGKQIALSMSAEDVLNMASGRAAAAIREERAGTISVGKRADVLLLRTDRLDFPVMRALAERVANFSSYSDLDSVWVAGVARKRGGRMVGVDMAALKQKVNAMTQRLHAQADTIRLT